TADPRALPLVTRLLRDVHLARDPEDAERRHRASPRFSFVTPDGVLVGPAVIRTAAESDARAEALRGELQAVDHELAAARSPLRPNAERLEELGREAEAVRAQLEQADARITSAADRMGRLAVRRSSLEKERE